MPPALRRHLPRTISRFASPRAVEILTAQLAREQDERVVYKILRGLGRLVADEPSLAVDRPALIATAEQMVARTVDLLAYRVADDLLRELATGAGGTPDATRPEVPPHEMEPLGALLAELEQRELERVFRVLQILETGEDFAALFAALSAATPAASAGAREVMGHVLDGRFRDVLLALTDGVTPSERLAAAASALPTDAAAHVLDAARLRAGAGAPHEVAAALAGVADAMRADRNALLSSLAAHGLPARLARLTPPVEEDPRVAS
jgi:hypothetical protein